MFRFLVDAAVAASLLLLLAGTPAAYAAESPPDGLSWPRSDTFDGHTFVVHQPQLDKWKGNRLEARAAVVLKRPGESEDVLGVAWLSARTEVDKKTRTVQLYSLTIDRAEFPSMPGAGVHYRDLLQKGVAGLQQPAMVVALDRLEAELALDQEHRETQQTELASPPPKILVSKVPAVLVPIAGNPVYRSVPETQLDRLINTRALLVRDADGRYYLHVYDGWVAAPGLDGPWEAVAAPSSGLVHAEEQAVDSGHVDLMTGAASAPKGQRPKLAEQVPAVFVETAPSALLVFDGDPDYVDVPQTQLLYAKNTDADVFVYIPKSRTYVLLAGRWFTAAGLDGPFTFVPSSELPADFRGIPDDSPKENVKASVAGTAQAGEALIASAIPQTATIEIETAKITTPVFDGEPKILPIDGTDLHYAANTALPVIQTAPDAWYAVENGVWFQSPAATGPWTVATSVPDAIYSIPPSSPLYYVTFSYVYGSGPGVVYVGYLPGYLGAYSTKDNVVYGTGHTYEPWVGNQYYPSPTTYEDGASVAYTDSGTWTVVYTTVYYPYWGPWWYYSGKNYWNDKHQWDPSWGALENIHDKWHEHREEHRDRIKDKLAEKGIEGPKDGAGRSAEQRAAARAGRDGPPVARNSRTGAAQKRRSEMGAGQRFPARKVPADPADRSGDGVLAGREGGEQLPRRELPADRGNDDLYAGRDGQVFRRTGEGQWQQHRPESSGWGEASPSRGDLDGSYGARERGNARVGGYRSGGGYGGGRGGGGLGGGGRGGFGGGGRRGGGGHGRR